MAVEFSVEEFETALITPNDTLGDIHIPLLKVGSFSFQLLKSLIFYFFLFCALKHTLWLVVVLL